MADSREVMNIRQASQYLGVSPDTLYKLDPTTKAVTVIGPFTGGCSNGSPSRPAR